MQHQHGVAVTGLCQMDSHRALSVGDVDEAMRHTRHGRKIAGIHPPASSHPACPGLSQAVHRPATRGGSRWLTAQAEPSQSAARAPSPDCANVAAPAVSVRRPR
jgi:hypothetical protein